LRYLKFFLSYPDYALLSIPAQQPSVSSISEQNRLPVWLLRLRSIQLRAIRLRPECLTAACHRSRPLFHAPTTSTPRYNRRSHHGYRFHIRNVNKALITSTETMRDGAARNGGHAAEVMHGRPWSEPSLETATNSKQMVPRSGDQPSCRVRVVRRLQDPRSSMISMAFSAARHLSRS